MYTNRRDFIRTASMGGLAVGLLPGFGRTGTFNPFAAAFTGTLPRATPESQGVSSAGISRFIDAANASGLSWHSFMLVRHGQVIAEGWWKPYEADFVHSLFSLSKSFTSTAIGLLVKEGKLDIDTPVIQFFPEDLPSVPNENLKKMRVRHLLTMTTGHEEDTLPQFLGSDKAWTKVFLEQSVKFEPGSHFVYNTGATYMLGAIVHKVTGELLEKYLTPRFFEPLGIREHDWEVSPEGLNMGGFGLRVKTEDIAKFGQFYLQKGKWGNDRILPEKWVEEATRAQVPSHSDNGEDWGEGYGFQFWRSKHGCFRADGYYGQYCLVMPEQDAVLAVTAEIPGMQKELNIIWDHLLPAIQPGVLNEDKKARAVLKKDLERLVLAVTKGSVQSSLSGQYDGKTFRFEKNDFTITQLQLRFSKGGCELVTKAEEKEMITRFGWENWLLNEDRQPYPFSRRGVFPFQVSSKLAGSATWLSDDTLQLDVRRVETMQGDKITCKFEGDKVSLVFLNSIAEKSKGEDAPEKRPPLTGSLAV